MEAGKSEKGYALMPADGSGRTKARFIAQSINVSFMKICEKRLLMQHSFMCIY